MLTRRILSYPLRAIPAVRSSPIPHAPAPWSRGHSGNNSPMPLDLMQRLDRGDTRSSSENQWRTIRSLGSSDEDLTAGTSKRIEDRRRCLSGGNQGKTAFEKPPVGARTYERTTEGFTLPPTTMKEARDGERFVWSGRWDLNHTPSPGRP
jgi:hypothetical protein